MISWSAVAAALKTAVSTLEGVAAQQGLQLVEGFEKALPAIQAGVASAEPFVLNGIKLLGNGGQPISADEWDAQLALLQTQMDIVDAQVAADERP